MSGSALILPDLGSRMRAHVDFLELLDGDLGIDLGRVQALMAEHLLDVADVGAVFQHFGGHGVAEEMTGARLLNAGFFGVGTDDSA